MGTFRPINEYLREAAGLTYSLFLEKYQHPVLIWPQAGDWMDYTEFQFETYVSDFNDKEPGEMSPHTESQIAQTMVIEIRKRQSSAPSNMICVGRAANNDIVLTNNTVSKLHTYFLMSGHEDSYEIVDANSTNGTLVNDVRLDAYKNQPLANRDYIQFGPSIQMVYLSPQGFFDLLQQLHRSGVT